MSASTNSLVATAKRFAVPAAAAATVLLAVAFMMGHSTAHAASGAAAPLDDNSVSSLVALDNAVEAVAARVTPAVVNVSVTSRASEQRHRCRRWTGSGHSRKAHCRLDSSGSSAPRARKAKASA